MQVNYLAVLVAAVLNMVAGAIWYSPMLFAKPWIKLTGKKDMQGGGVGYGIAALCSLAIAYVLAHFVQLAGAMDWMDGVKTGLWAWVGFVATTAAANYVFEGRPWKLYWINVGYPLVAFVLMGALLAAWH